MTTTTTTTTTTSSQINHINLLLKKMEDKLKAIVQNINSRMDDLEQKWTEIESKSLSLYSKENEREMTPTIMSTKPSFQADKMPTENEEQTHQRLVGAEYNTDDLVLLSVTYPSRTPSKSRQFWIHVYQILLERGVYTEEIPSILSEASEITFGYAQSYIPTTVASMESRIVAWRTLLKNRLVKRLKDIVGLQDGQDLDSKCQRLYQSKEYLHDGTKLYQSLILARALYYMYCDPQLEFTFENFEKLPIPALAFCISTLEFGLTQMIKNRQGKSSTVKYTQLLLASQKKNPEKFNESTVWVWNHAKKI